MYTRENEGQQHCQNGPHPLSIRELFFAWTLAARAENKSENTVRSMLSALSFFTDYLNYIGMPDEVQAVVSLGSFPR